MRDFITKGFKLHGIQCSKYGLTNDLMIHESRFVYSLSAGAAEAGEDVVVPEEPPLHRVLGGQPPAPHGHSAAPGEDER